MLVTELITEKFGEEDTKFRITSDEINKITKGGDGEGESVPLLSPYSFSEGGLTSTTDSITRYMHYLLTSSSADVTQSQTLLAGSANTHGHAFFGTHINMIQVRQCFITVEGQ